MSFNNIPKYQQYSIVGVKFKDDDNIMQKLRPAIVLNSYWNNEKIKVVPLTSSQNRYHNYEHRIPNSNYFLYIQSVDSLARIESITTVDYRDIVLPYFFDGRVIERITYFEAVKIIKAIAKLDNHDELIENYEEVQIKIKIGDTIDYLNFDLKCYVNADILDINGDVVYLYVNSSTDDIITKGVRLIINKQELELNIVNKQ